MGKSKTRFLVSLLLAVAMLGSSFTPLFGRSQVLAADNPLVDLNGTISSDVGKPAKTTLSSDVSVGEIVVALVPRNEVMFEALATAVQDPKSPYFRQFANDAEIARKYAPQSSVVDELKDYFKEYGVSLSYQSSDKLFVGFKGTITQLDQAFHTKSDYRTTSKGDTGFINTSALRLPASLSRYVKGVVGFDTLHKFTINSSLAQTKADPYRISPSTAITAGNTPTSTRIAYGIESIGLSGAGTKMGITLWGAPNMDDLGRWVNYWGKPLNLDIIPPTAGAVEDGLRYEANMDVQIVHMVAPQTNIRFYIADAPYEAALLKSISKALDDNVNAITNSWAGCDKEASDASLRSYNRVFQLASLKGIPIFFGSGDSGIFTCNDPNSYQPTIAGYSTFPANNGLVTAVGGTLLSRDDTTDEWFNESGWSCSNGDPQYEFFCLQTFGGSSGGGQATRDARPAYQSNIIPPVEARFTYVPTTTKRLLPDVSMSGDMLSGIPIFIHIPGFPPFSPGCNDDCRSGGTSASTPLMASIMLLAAQRAGGQVGGINPFLYANANASWLFDVTDGYNGGTGRVGWDYVTGLGSMRNANGFVNAFTAPALRRPYVSATSRQLSDALGNNNGVVEPGETITLQITLYNGGALAASGVASSLSLLSGNASLLNASSAYPNLAIGASATNAQPYRFVLNGGAAACGVTLRFRQTVTYNSGLTYTYDFSVPTGTPQFGTPTTYTYPGDVINIPDNNLEGITLELPISAPNRVGDMNVRFSATHTNVGDLSFTLISPLGVQVSLVDVQGGAGDNFYQTTLDDEVATPLYLGTPPYSGSYLPEEPLSAVDTELISGVWKLHVVDSKAGNSGTLTQWAVDIRPATYCSSTAVIPSVSSLNPSSAIAGSSDLFVTVNGSNFTSSSVVRWNGSNRTTSFVNSQSLSALITASDLANAGSAAVTVYEVGAGVSNAQTFTIVSPPSPNLASMSPSSIVRGSGSFTLNVVGTNFTPNSVIRWNGANRNTSYVDSTRLYTVIGDADISTAGTANVTVYTPSAANLSNSLTFTIVDNEPATTSLSLTSSSNSSSVGQNVVFTATINPSTARGMVTFKEGSTILGSANIEAGGVANLTINSLEYGRHIITATYDGNNNFAASTSNALTQEVYLAGKCTGRCSR